VRKRQSTKPPSKITPKDSFLALFQLAWTRGTFFLLPPLHCISTCPMHHRPFQDVEVASSCHFLACVLIPLVHSSGSRTRGDIKQVHVLFSGVMVSGLCPHPLGNSTCLSTQPTTSCNSAAGRAVVSNKYRWLEPVRLALLV